MSEKENGGMAFPMYFGSQIQPQGGMTLRAYMATKAMQGILATATTWPAHADIERVVSLSVFAADAMLKELDR